MSAIEHSRESYDANVKHTYYYLFQKQGLVANKDQLLYRQNEAFQPQTIRDTLPIFLGVSSNDRYELEAKLRAAQRELKLNASYWNRLGMPSTRPNRKASVFSRRPRRSHH